jgi:hypothetical protein
MCLIIHQPGGATTPLELLRSAAEYNPDGFGFMAMDDARAHIVRATDAADAERLAATFAGRECAFHFRRRTRGSMHADNLHPFALGGGLFLMHNGTAKVDLHSAGHSDTWHLVQDYLSPLLARRRRLIYDRSFRKLLDRAIGPDNRLVILDSTERQICVMHGSRGYQWNGLWLSNTSWLDRRMLPADAPPSKALLADQVRFA